MRFVIILVLMILLSITVGSSVTPAQFRAAENLCLEHGDLKRVDVMPSAPITYVQLTAVCNDGVEVIRQFTEPRQ
jgi:hypothetical protein